MKVGMMRWHSEEEVLAEIEKSVSHRNTKRFERKDLHEKTYIRAMFCRNFEPVSLLFFSCSYIALLSFSYIRILLFFTSSFIPLFNHHVCGAGLWVV